MCSYVVALRAASVIADLVCDPHTFANSLIVRAWRIHFGFWRIEPRCVWSPERIEHVCLIVVIAFHTCASRWARLREPVALRSRAFNPAYPRPFQVEASSCSRSQSRLDEWAGNRASCSERAAPSQRLSLKGRPIWLHAHSMSLIGVHIGACDEICTTLLAQTHEHAHKDMCNTSDDAL